MTRLLAGFASLLVAIVLCLAAAVGYLTATPAGQAFLRGHVERLASAALGPDIEVELGAQRLDFAARGAVGIAFDDVVLRHRTDRTRLATLSQGSVGVSIGALLRGRVDLDAIRIDGLRVDPSLADRFGSGTPDPDRIIAGIDRGIAALRRLGLSSIEIEDAGLIDRPQGPRLVSLDLTEEGADTFALAATVRVADRLIAADASATLAADADRLQALSIAVPDIALVSPGDGAASGATLGLALSTSVSAGTRTFLLAADAAVPLHEPVEALGSPAPGDAARHVTLPERTRIELAYVEGSGSLSLRPLRLDFGRAAATLEGRIALRADERGARGIELSTRELVSTVGADPQTAEAARLSVSGALEADGTLDLPKLRLEAGGGTIDGSARWTGGTGPDSRIGVSLAGENVSAAAVRAFWPVLIAPETRDWVLKHVDPAGAVADARFEFGVSWPRLVEMTVPGHGPSPEELRLDARIVAAGFGVLETMPRLRNVSLRVAVAGGDTRIDFDEGRIDGAEGVTVKPSSIAFHRRDVGRVGAEVALALSGDLGEMLAVADNPPIRALDRIGWKREDVSGRADVAIAVDLGLGRGVAQSDILENWSVLADVKGADLRRSIEGRRLANLTGTVSVSPGTAIGTLDGTLDGIPARIEFTRPFAPDPVGTPSLAIEAKLSDAVLADRLPGLKTLLDGPVAAKLVQAGEAFDAEIDLRDARLTLPGVEWTKGKGVPAKLTFKAAFSEGGLTRVSDAKLSGEGFAAVGAAEIDREGLKTLQLDRAVFNAGDDFRLQLQRTKNGLSAVLKGDQFDARPILASLRASAGRKGGGGGGGARDLDVTVDLGRLVGFGKETLRGVSLAFAQRGGRLASARFDGESPSSAPLSLALDGEKGVRRLSLATSDAGVLLRFAGVYPRMAGGQARVELQGSDKAGYTGALRIDGFTLVDEPRLASLVGTTSSSDDASLARAIGRDIEVANAYFDTASLSLSYRDERLVVEDGIVRGPVFGSSFAGLLHDGAGGIDIGGSFMPAYGINRIFGALPFVGGILGNGNEGGLIGITYRLSGAFADPTLAINPISAIAPGIFRRIFQM
ncbi:hypothetical protein [Aurantimonas sp. Leaf443]|uniref:hypothetical protein n=1 Tax=Aurantimonas sp. Leaf443 TaxID=1736378 RepID=UPI0006F949AF|nr:hypothetical protein [Aurantimonas sp. Leaf443]KQT83432.1 hypothetical protein ASG48_12795 [Aurantimonas sp. Leaf443]